MNKLYEEASISDIADAIRSKNGSSTQYKVSEMGNAIRAITTGEGISPSGTTTITENGTYDVADYAQVIVNVAGGGGMDLPSKMATGTFTYDEYQVGTVVRTINHNMGVVPKFMVVMVDDYSVSERTNTTLGGHVLGSIQGTILKNGVPSYIGTQVVKNLTETSFDFGGASATYGFPPEYTYRWFAWS